jgi:hypothetical protein
VATCAPGLGRDYSVGRSLSYTLIQLTSGSSRIWIMRGYLDSNMGVLNGGVEFYKRTLEVLEWGRRTYPNVPSEVSRVLVCLIACEFCPDSEE